MYQIKQSEATAARRRIPVLLVDITDGFTPETGVVTPTINVSKNGATIATGAGSWTEIGNGQYYYELTAGEVDTLGWIALNIEKATVSRDYNAVVQVMAYDYAAATNLGLTAIPNVATGSAGAIPTTGTGANQIQVNGSGAISIVNTVSGSVGSVTGAVGSVTGNVGGSVASVVGAVGSVTGSVGSVVGAVGSVTGNIGGNLTGSVGSLTATAVQNIWDDLTANNTVVGSIGVLIGNNLNATVSSRATDAGVWAVGTRTLTAGTNIVLAKGTGITGFNDIAATDVWAAATRTLSSGANIVLAKGAGITGFNDISAQNVWDVATSGLTTVGSIGLKLNTNVDTTISSRMATFTYTTPPTVAQIATQVWSEPIPGTFAVGSAGAKLNAASSAGDPWATALPGAYGAGTAGNILGNRLDAAITTRMATFTYTVPPTSAAIATQVWSEALPGTYTSGQAGFKLNAAGGAADPWSTALPGAYSAGSAGFIIGNRLDAAVSTRLASASYTAPPTTAAIATQVWSEVLPGTYTATQAGFKLNAAGSSADPWSTSLPGAYTSGTAGFIIGNRLDTNVGSRMATFTLPTNFSLLSISGTGGVTAGTVSDKTGYSLSTSQTFNTSGSIGSVVGSVGSVSGSIAGNVLGTVASVVGNVGGNVVGSVGSVVGSVGSVSNVSNIWDYLTSSILTTNSIGLLLKTNVDAQISTRLASSSYTVSPTVAQIWQAALPGSFTLGQAGYILGTNLDALISSRLASSSYSAAPSASTIMSAIWNQVRATSNGGGTPAVGTFGYFLDSRVSTAGGSGGGVIVKQGPFKLNATQDMGQNDILDLVQNDARNIVLEVIDEVGEPIPLSGAFIYTVNVYDIGGTGAGTYTGTVDYANGGQVSFDITTTTTSVKGTYYIVLSIDNGTIITKYGGLRLEVR